jgi:hypothetical protein
MSSEADRKATPRSYRGSEAPPFFGPSLPNLPLLPPLVLGVGFRVEGSEFRV